VPDLRSCVSRRSCAFDVILFRAPVRFCPFAQFLSPFPPRKMNRDHWFPARFSSLSQTRRPSTASAYTTFLRARHNFFSNYQTQLPAASCLTDSMSLQNSQPLCNQANRNSGCKTSMGRTCAARRWSLYRGPSFFVAPLFSWSYELLFPQALWFQNYLRCPPGCGVHSD